MDVVLLLGGNIGDVRDTLDEASANIGDRMGTVLAKSRDHCSEPWGFTDERLFLNRAILVRTDLNPRGVLEEGLAIELALGRTRTPGEGYRARNIDIDILFAGDRVVVESDLRIPHPRLHLRTFALAPAADIVPDLIHPALGRTVLSLLNDVLHPD